MLDPFACQVPLTEFSVCLQTGKFIPEKSNIWRDCVDGYLDWVKEHILEVRHQSSLQQLQVVITIMFMYMDLLA